MFRVSTAVDSLEPDLLTRLTVSLTVGMLHFPEEIEWECTLQYGTSNHQMV